MIITLPPDEYSMMRTPSNIWKLLEKAETEWGKREDTKHLSLPVITMAPGTQGHQGIP